MRVSYSSILRKYEDFRSDSAKPDQMSAYVKIFLNNLILNVNQLFYHLFFNYYTACELVFFKYKKAVKNNYSVPISSVLIIQAFVLCNLVKFVKLIFDLFCIRHYLHYFIFHHLLKGNLLCKLEMFLKFITLFAMVLMENYSI